MMIHHLNETLVSIKVGIHHWSILLSDNDGFWKISLLWNRPSGNIILPAKTSSPFVFKFSLKTRPLRKTLTAISLF